jgi:hypothetical protein
MMLLLFSLSAEFVNGKISRLHVHTKISNNALMVGFTEIRLQNITLESPCSWLHVYPEDNNALSLLLAARTQDKVIQIHYELSKAAPWGAGSCAITGVQIQ